MSATRRLAAIGLGSNLGDRAATLRSAAAALAATPGITVVGRSGIYESPPMGEVPQGPYLNAVLTAETALSAAELLAVGLAVERAHGRERRVRWGPRTLDVDLLWLAGERVETADLVVPHPGLASRAFVLLPLAELLPDLVLPDGRGVHCAIRELGVHGCVRLPGTDL